MRIKYVTRMRKEVWECGPDAGGTGRVGEKSKTYLVQESLLDYVDTQRNCRSESPRN